jgi:hypothetical protein
VQGDLSSDNSLQSSPSGASTGERRALAAGAGGEAATFKYGHRNLRGRGCGGAVGGVMAELDDNDPLVEVGLGAGWSEQAHDSGVIFLGWIGWIVYRLTSFLVNMEDRIQSFLPCSLSGHGSTLWIHPIQTWSSLVRSDG